MQVKEIHKKVKTKMAPEKYEDAIKKLRKEHEKPVKGMFEFIDAQGGWLDFSYRFFKGDPLSTIHLVHGEITEIPMGLVRHLNNVKKKIRRFGQEIVNERGLPSTYETVSRVRFTPVDMF